MSAKRKRPKGWLITALISTCMVGYAVFVFLPKQRAINEMRTQLREYQQFVLQSDALAASEMNLKNSFAQTLQFNEQWRSGAPARHRLAPFVNQVTIAARETNVSIIRLTPQTVGELDTVAKIPIVIESRGQFEALHAFIHKLEQLPATVWLDDLHIQSLPKEQGQGGELSCELTLAVFADNRGNSG